jgi:hypothetical protein
MGRDDLQRGLKGGPQASDGDVMATLPAHPNLAHLRRQARDLLRAANAGDADAMRRLEGASDRLNLSTAQLHEKAHLLVERCGVELLIVDYVHLMLSSINDKRHENRVQEIGEISRSLKAIARELAIPVLAGSAAYAMAGAFRWNSSLEEKPAAAKEFYGIITAATLVGAGLGFTTIDPIKALFWSAVLNCVISVPIMVVMMVLSSKPEVMGPFVVKRRLRLLGWFATLVMSAAATPTITPRIVSNERRRLAQSASQPLSSPAPIISPRWTGAFFFCDAGARLV